jgi:hypothetical protein
VGFRRRWSRISTKFRSLSGTRCHRTLRVFQKNFQLLTNLGHLNFRSGVFAYKSTVICVEDWLLLKGLNNLRGLGWVVGGVVYGLLNRIFKNDWSFFMSCSYFVAWRRLRFCFFNNGVFLSRKLRGLMY